MGMTVRLLSLALLVLLSSTPCLASTTIAQLGSAPLLGSSSSTSDLQLKVARNEARLKTAGRLLGMSAEEYRAFRAEIQTRKPGWVVVPRHLDAMAWYAPQGVHVIRDVIIPANTNGWQINVDEPGQTLEVYLPATCGNLSILRRRHPVVAAKPVKRSRVIATRPPWAVSPFRQVAPPPAAAAPAETAQVVPSPAPPPKQVFIGTAPHGGLPGWLPGLILLFVPIGGGGGHSGSHPGPGAGGSHGGGPCGCP